MKMRRKTKAVASTTANERVAAEVNAIVDEFIRENPRLEFTDTADLDDKEAEKQEQELADIYRKHLGLLGSN